MRSATLVLVCLSSAASFMACEKKSAANRGAVAGSTAPAAVPQPALAGKNGPAPTPGAPLFDAAAGLAGVLRVGMSRAEAQTALPLSPDPSGHMGENVAVPGAYRLVFDAQNALGSVEYNLTQSGVGARIGTTNVAPTATVNEVVAAFGACGPAVAGEGGEQTACAGGRALVKSGRACEKKDARGACAEWSAQRRDVLLQILAAPVVVARAPGSTAPGVSRAQCEAAMTHVLDLATKSSPATAGKLRAQLAAKTAECERDATAAELACVMAARDTAGLGACHAMKKAR